MSATPQVENGYTRIANEILEKLAQVHLPPNEWRVLMLIFRSTYGHGKKQALISNGFLAKGTGLDRSNVIRTLKRLQSRHIVSVTTLGGRKTVGFQKDHTIWDLVSAPTPSVSHDTKTSVSTDTQKRKKEKLLTPKGMSATRTPPPREAVDAADLLADLILENNPNNTQLKTDAKRTATCNRWAYDIDKLHRIDGFTWEQITYLIRWSQKDHFWSTNILSGDKLRKQADRLVVEIKRKATSKPKPQGRLDQLAEELNDWVMENTDDPTASCTGSTRAVRSIPERTTGQDHDAGLDPGTDGT